MFSQKAIEYFSRLTPPDIPGEPDVMNPYADPVAMNLVRKFYLKYYNDDNPRIFIFGINPGRFGGGLTGISFTDPIALRTYCKIENDLGSKRELSSEFIYRMIEAYGGTELFFGKCYLTALFPFALINKGKNYNFYDDKELMKSLLPYMSDSVKRQNSFGARRDKVVSLGLKNAGILRLLNDELKIFASIEILEHPRFIMQYKRKSIDNYISKYLNTLR
jgi:hypothetical protein